jgi:hypothetical protein
MVHSDRVRLGAIFRTVCTCADAFGTLRHVSYETRSQLFRRGGCIFRAASEAIAVFTLIFAGCGAVVADARYDGALGTVGIAYPAPTGRGSGGI